MSEYLKNINSPADLKKLSLVQLPDLAAEIRETLLTRLMATGGHAGPNLGMVEATIALHYVFDSPADKFVFDVSHQCYVHKMLTGRKDGLQTRSVTALIPVTRTRPKVSMICLLWDIQQRLSALQRGWQKPVT